MPAIESLPPPGEGGPLFTLLPGDAGAIFRIGAGWSVRVAVFDGSPWFHLADVGGAFGLRAVHKAAARLDAGRKRRHLAACQDQRRHVIVVSEAGVYDVAHESEHPEVKAFIGLVYREVIPSILVRGVYQHSQPALLAAERLHAVQEPVDRLTIDDGMPPRLTFVGASQ